MKLLTIITLCFLHLASIGQDDTLRIIFNKDNKPGNYQNYFSDRFTPTEDEINILDSVAVIYVHLDHFQSISPKYNSHMEDYDKYYRQYVGLINKNGNKIILVSGFCKHYADTHNYKKIWKKKLVSSLIKGGGACYFSLMYDVKTGMCFNFVINAPM